MTVPGQGIPIYPGIPFTPPSPPPSLQSAIIYFMGPITNYAVSLLLEALGQMRHEKIPEITICLHSCGGEIGAAIVGYNYIRQIKTSLTMHNLGNVDSAAVILYLAANIRVASPHSSFFLHPGEWRGQNDMNLARARDLVTVAEFDTDRYARIFKERTGDVIDIRAALERERLQITGNAACDAGITTTRETVVPPMVVDKVHWIRSQ